MSISFQEWLDIVGREYLHDFVRLGGAAVKFLIPYGDHQYDRCHQELRRVADSEGFLFVSVDAANTKIHMIDRLFHEIARKVSWEDFAYKFLIELINNNGYKVPPNRVVNLICKY